MKENVIRPELMLASGNAAIRHLYSRTTTFVDTRDQSFGENSNWQVFSGSLVRFNNKVLVATVSHSIETETGPTRYYLVSKSGHPEANCNSIIRRTISTTDNRPDVGIVELDEKELDRFDDHEAIDISQISIAPADRQLGSIVGLPAETVKIHPVENGGWGIGGTIAGFTTAAINPDKWPSLNLTRPLDPSIDMLVSYPNDSPNIRDDEGLASSLPIPKGISGGGFWIHDPLNTKLKQKELWLPDNCKLVGIQASWMQDAEYVRLTKISKWLDLVWKNYPELRDELRNIEGYR